MNLLRQALSILTIGTLCIAAQGDELDEPPAMDEDPHCLARKAAREAYLRSIVDVPVSQGQPCPPDPETIRQREVACRTETHNARVWEFVSDGFQSGSAMLTEGVSGVIETLGEPLREEREEGFWDIDIYEIPRTLYFPGVTVKTRDYVSDAVNFDLATGTVEPTDAIYEMLVESGDFRFAHNLAPGSHRDDVEAALGLPCAAVARLGRTALRSEKRYSYVDTTDEDRSRFTVTFNFDGAGRVESVHWYYDSVWH